MKALMKKAAESGAVLTDVDVPTIGDDDVLLKVRATSICGTDRHKLNIQAADKTFEAWIGDDRDAVTAPAQASANPCEWMNITIAAQGS